MAGLYRFDDLRVPMRLENPTLEQTIDFVLREGETEIPCRVSFGALSRQAGADALSRDRAERLFRWYREEIERIALARYAVGDFSGGVVTIDADDIGSPPGQR